MSIDYFPASPDAPLSGQSRHIISGLSTALPATATAGQVLYETNTGAFKYWTGSAWKYLNQTLGNFDRITIADAASQADGIAIGGSNAALWIDERDASSTWALYASAAKFRINGSGTDMLTVTRTAPANVGVEYGLLNMAGNPIHLYSAGDSNHRLVYANNLWGSGDDGPHLIGYNQVTLLCANGANWSLKARSDGTVRSRGDIYSGGSGIFPGVTSQGQGKGYGANRFHFSGDGNDMHQNWGAGWMMWVDVTHVKTFVIDHPLDENRHLIHAAIEGPEAAVFYRGESQLEDGWVEIQLPEYFEALCAEEGRAVQLTCIADDPADEWCPVLHATYPKNGKFYVGLGSGMAIRDQRFWWQVTAVRKDAPPLLVEPAKEDVVVMGQGPYTYYKEK
jgi:hypothetical protein